MAGPQAQGGGSQNVGAAFGPKLQILIQNGCIDPEAAGQLVAQQRSAIEALSYAQIGALVDSHLAVGPVPSAQLI